MTFAAFYTVQNIDSTTFYAHSSDSAVFWTHRNDHCGFLEIETCRPNSPENRQNPSFFVGIMPTIIFPGREVEDGGG
jgi:hypothetical protein